MISDLIKSNRTRRIYDGNQVSFNVLREIVESCRYSASTMNRQDIRYVLVNNLQVCSEIFNITNLPTAHKITPEVGPGGYAVMTVRKDLKIPDSFLYYNLGMATSIFTLTATSLGYSCVTLLSTNMEKLSRIISLEDDMKAISVIGIGKSVQKIRIEDIETDKISYYKDGNIHVVPKITSEKIISKEI